VADAGVEGDLNTSAFLGDDFVGCRFRETNGEVLVERVESGDGSMSGVPASLLTSCSIVSMVIPDPPIEVLTANAGVQA